MQKTIMDPQIYKQLGELTGRFNTFEATITKQFDEVKEAIKNQSVVPYSVYEKHVLESEARFKVIEDDTATIKQALKIRESSLTGRLAIFFDSAVVKIVGTAVIGIVLFGIYMNYQNQIDILSRKLNNVQQQPTINVIEDKSQ